jgi:hypothetical protein
MMPYYIALLIEPTDKLHQLYTLFVESQKNQIPLRNRTKLTYSIHCNSKLNPNINFYESFIPTNNIRLCGIVNGIEGTLNQLLTQCLLQFLQYEPMLPETFLIEFKNECDRLENQVPSNTLAYQEPPKGIE